MGEARNQAIAAKEAQKALARLSSSERNGLLLDMAQGLRSNMARLLEANAQDVDAARKNGTREQLIDRLLLSEARIEDMAQGLEGVAGQAEPLGRILTGQKLANGMTIEKITVPLGVVAMVFEARPNVTSDAAGLCIKTGNACLLKGGSLAANSIEAIGAVLQESLEKAGISKAAIGILDPRNRGEVEELFNLTGLVDVLIPRGGAGLIKNCVENSKVPVIETGTGNCHTYIESTADLDMALNILRNAKCSRPSVCNACESVLIDRVLVQKDPLVVEKVITMLNENGVKMHGDETVCAAGQVCGISVEPATEADWGTEYLDLEISIKIIDGVDKAIEHINTYGTKHSECIVTQDYAAAQKFLEQVDASAVYVNASTRFTDGGMFGLGAEIGISTQRLHARGPMGADALVTAKYICRGSGQVR